jgi:enterochelin esterase-like enzyme
MPAAGATSSYNGEWAGQWERELTSVVVPWVDRSLPTIAGGAGRILAGLSAGGYGAVDIAIRHPTMFGTAESWSGYFTPLRDGPFRRADAATLAAHDPVELVRSEASELRARRVRFFVSTGPAHSHWIRPASTLAFASELRALGIPVAYRSFATVAGEWRDQLDAGLGWALAA